MNRKRILIIVIVIANLLFVWSVFNMFYYKKASFDTSEKTELNPKVITRIINGDGSWKWNEQEYDFYKAYSFSLTQSEIIEFCKIVNSSNAKYIENIRPKKWFDIEIQEKNGNEKTITLKQIEENEIYFEIEHKTFEGKELEKYIEKHLKRN